ncbi:MAG: hypothetical protein JNG84_12335, partial [Archangium sp.]|nr:hypothetical protein [Archangium sp.]
LSDEGGYQWKLAGSVAFETSPGLEVQVAVTPVRDGKQADIAKRFVLKLPARPVMLAEVDDAPLPPPPKPVLAKVVVDAGPPPPPPPFIAPPLVAATPKERAPVMADDSAPSVQRRPERRSPREPNVAAAEPAPSAPAAERFSPQPEVLDAGAAVVDAPPPVAPPPPVVVVRPPAAPPAEGGGLRWVLIGAGALALVGLFIALARRRSQVPRIDE